jgi:xanthosine utilization system XapX-like protein
MTAPHAQVDHAWETDFVVELRLQDVDGRLIGDALEQVRAHCAESGESATEAFGEPAAYARSLGLPAEPARLGGVLVLSLVGLVGMYLTLNAVMAWRTDETFALTVGFLVAAGVVVLAVVLAARHLRGVIDHPVRSIGTGAILLAVAVTAGELLTGVVARLPAPPVVALGVAMLLGTAIIEHRAAGRTADPVVSPVDAAAAAGARRSAVRTGVLGAWLLPGATAVLGAVVWFLL